MAWQLAGLPDATLADPPPYTTVALLRPLSLALGRLGVDPVGFLRDVGVPNGAGEGPVLGLAVNEVLETLAQRLGVPHLAIELVRNVPLGTFGSADYRFSASAVLLEAMETFGPRQNEFGNCVRYEAIIEEGSTRIEMCPLFRFPRLYPVSQTFAVALVVRRLRDVLGEAAVKLSAVRLVCPAPASSRVYDDFFGVAVQFGAESYDLAFPSDLLQAPLLTANPEIAKILADRTPALGASPTADAFVASVRGAIASCLAQPYPSVNIVDVSSRLVLTPRSLQRRLRDKGVSFSGLVDAARRERAQQLLSEQGMLLCEIAYQLGFSGVTQFYRAFRRWTGTSPREFQRGRSAPR